MLERTADRGSYALGTGNSVPVYVPPSNYFAMIRAVKNANGEYTVHRGPLQYALPIDHGLHSTKDYPLPDFHDHNITPEDMAKAYRLPLLVKSQADLGCTFARIDAAGAQPWDQPPVKVPVDGHELAPLGCTVLRRSTLPLT